ncbi:hypothetical protein TNCV_3262021 [Trichonephila clavipes]|nr:hypothetical protein TNCV_3262021 [Trichonephila clavipes]
MPPIWISSDADLLLAELHLGSWRFAVWSVDSVQEDEECIFRSLDFAPTVADIVVWTVFVDCKDLAS